jgi:hypothetical protein
MTYQLRPWTTRTTSPLSIGEEPGQKQTNRVVNHVEDTLLDEEVINLDPDQKEEETQVAETTPIDMANSATSARSKDTDKKNARKGSKKTNPAETPKDRPTGQGSTSWTRLWKRRPSTLSITRT